MSDLRLDDIAEGRRGHRAPRSRGPGCIPALIVVIILVALGVFAYVKGVHAIKSLFNGDDHADYSGAGQGSVVVEVKSGDSSSAVASTLVGANVVKSAGAFTDAAAGNPQYSSLQAGCYKLRKQMSAQSALALMLKDTSHVSCPNSADVTIPEGLRAKEILAKIADETTISMADLNKAYKDTKALGLPDYAKGDAEGYLFPATYPVTKDTTAASILKDMVDKFKSVADDIGLEDNAAQLGVSPHDIVIIASLIQAEGRRPEDLPKIASVIYNRLDIDMPLQLDSTLHYAIDSRGEIQTSTDLTKMDSDYNTYQLTGLPPTAIDSPGVDALNAALNPANTDYLYFVTVNLATGETKFAETLAEHDANRQELDEYCQTSDEC